MGITESLRHRRPLRWIWYIFGFAFLVIEGYAILSKEETVPTLSRTIWFLREQHPMVKAGVGGILIWLFFHLSMGEDAEDLHWDE